MTDAKIIDIDVRDLRFPRKKVKRVESTVSALNVCEAHIINNN